MKNKIKVFNLMFLFLLTSCQNKNENKINYYQEYTSAYVYYKIDSEKEGYQYIKEKELNVELLNESKTFFIDLINSNFENLKWISPGNPGTYTFNLVLKYGNKFDFLIISKEDLDPVTSVWFYDEKGNRIYPTNGYMTYEYYQRMFNLIDKYDALLSDVEWKEIKFDC